VHMVGFNIERPLALVGEAHFGLETGCCKIGLRDEIVI